MKHTASVASLVFLFIMTIESQLNLVGRLEDGTLEPQVRTQQTFSGYFKPLSYEAAMKAMRHHANCVTAPDSLCKIASPK